ncbi:MAG: TonB-dependent receptor [Porticoccaceae bacterium]|nr:TonB-dependent receptor [Porticoccaceae bacterium]
MLFKKKVLSSSVALALVGSTMPALAQDEGLEIEEVIVEGGIRASLKKSMDIKRDTAGVADAISAEDMGKFPDTNLAEALQRVTGVSINRERGEGSKVTVRGFGPEYNMVTLNGRQMPTHSGTSRAYDFADIASEGISAVVVSKTGDAAAPSGGIGSSINIITTKPLEAGTVRSLGLKSVFDTSVLTGDKATPEIAGLISETFADDTIGVSLSFSAQERNSAERSGSVGGWRSNYASAVDARLTVPADDEDGERHLNRPQIGDYFDSSECDVVLDNCELESISILQSMAYNLSEYESSRINGQLTMQWRPVESLTATVDYTHSELDVEKSYNDLSAWFNGQGAVEQTSEWEEGVPVSTPLMYREVGSNNDFAMGLGRNGFINENDSVGLNLEWYASDRLQLGLDYHESKARSGANTDYGTNSLITMASFNRTVSKVYFTEDFPILELGLDPNNPITESEAADPAYEDRPLYKDDMIITGSVFGNGKSLMEIKQLRLNGSYDFSDITTIDFGIETTEVSNSSVGSNVQRDTWGGVSQPGDISDVLVRTTMENNFDNISGGDNSLRQTESFWAPFDDIVNEARQLDAGTWTHESQKQGTCDVPEMDDVKKINWYCASTDWDTDLRTTETTDAVYMQLSVDEEIAGLPASLRAGLRYEETEVESTAMTPKFLRTEWTGGNEFNLVKDVDEDGIPVIVFVPQYGGYELLLPNLDINVEFTDDIVGRISTSKTVTRPNYQAIKGGTTVGGTSYKYGDISASRGAPDLDPIESINLDVSFEWYYDDASYLSTGWFRKKTKNFIGTTKQPGVTITDWPGLTDVSNGGAWSKAVADATLTAQNTDPDAVVQPNDFEAIKPELVNMPTPEDPLQSVNADDVVNDDTGSLVENGPLEFTLSYPVNQKAANVYGWEFNIQHNFGESGFGVIANYTKAWSDQSYVTNPTTEKCISDEVVAEGGKCMITQFALSGLSDSANLIAFYDKDGLNARIAYNWRDDFFAGDGQGQGAFYADNGDRRIGENPTFVQDYGQIDISASYEINDNLTVFLDGINVTNESNRNYGRTERQVLRAGQTGARYNLGVRYNF